MLCFDLQITFSFCYTLDYDITRTLSVDSEKPFHSIFGSVRALPTNSQLVFKLYRQKTDFLVISEPGTEYILEIMDCHFYCQFFKPSPSALAMQNRILAAEKFDIPFLQHDVFTFNIGQGRDVYETNFNFTKKL